MSLLSGGRRLIALSTLLATLVATTSAAWAGEMVIPLGTTVYGELDQEVTSKKKETAVGDIIRAHVWRDVVVDGQVVIPAGSPLLVRVAHVKKAKFAGIKGKLELEAVSVRGPNGSDILLDGGYDKSGKGRKALSISLAALVAWPLVFIKGKQAVLEPGTVFDAAIQEDTVIEVAGSTRPRLQIAQSDSLSVEVLYDEVDPQEKIETLPVTLRRCGGSLEAAAVVTVNEEDIEPIPLSVEAAESDGEDCLSARATLPLKVLAKSFRRGINRFEVEVGDERSEVVLDIEL